MKIEIEKMQFCYQIVLHKSLNVIRVLLSIIRAILGLVLIFINGTVTDMFGSDKIFVYLLYWCVVFIATQLVDCILYITYKKIYKDTYYALTLSIVKKWLSKTEKDRSEHQTDVFITSLEKDCSAICKMGINSMSRIIILLFDLAISAIILLRYNALLMIIVILFSLLESLQFQKNLYKIQDKYEKENFRTNSEVNAWTKGIFKRFEHIKAFNLSEWSKNIILDKVNENYKIRTKQSVLGTFAERLKYLPTWLCETIFYIVGGIFIINGSFSLGGLVICIRLMGKCMSSFSKIITDIKDLKISLNSYDRLNSFGLLIEKRPRDCASISESSSKNIEINKVSFAYNDNTIFDNLNLSIPLNGVLLIKGSNGSGKSTLLSLLMGINKPDSGDITINGVNTKDISIDMYNNIFACVLQDGVILKSSIVDNICFYNEFEKSRFDEITDEIFKDKPGLLSYKEIETSEASVSGGEKKRILLARSLYKQSDILILDEADTNMDIEGLIKLVQTIKEVSKNKLIIVVSHSYDLFLNENIISYVIDTDSSPIHIDYIEEPSLQVLSLLSRTLNNNDKSKLIEMHVIGRSMEPTYYPGDLVKIQIGKFNMEKNDIILYNASNKVILHRIVEIREGSVICKGDNNILSELVDCSSIIGKVIE